STPNHNFALTHIRIFSPTLLNQAQFSLTRRKDTGQPVWTTSFVDLGMRNVFTDEPNPNFGLRVTGAFSATVTEKITTAPNAFTIADTLRWTAGRHGLSMGFEYRKQNLNKNFRWLLDPAIRFEGDFTGFGVSDFFLGMPSFLDQMAFGEVAEQDFPVYVGFIQDDVKLSPKLTLNLGVRYEPSIPYRDAGNRVSVFRPGQQSRVFVNAPEGLLFVGDPGVPERGTESDLNNFAPRVGLAWAPFQRTSIRAAYGIFYDSSPMSAITNVFQGVAPFGTRLRLRPPPGPFDDPYLGNNPFPMPFPPPSDVAFPDGMFAATYPDQYKTGYLQSWHLTVERELFPDWLLRVAYAGSKGTNLLQGFDRNAAIYIPGQSTRANISERRPFGPAFDAIAVVDNIGSSSFNSLQVTVDKRFSRGLTILANYTWAKSIDFGSGGGTLWPDFSNPFDHSHDRGLSDFHHEHRFVTSWLWELPRLTSYSPVVKGVLGGWALSGALSLQSGAPFSIRTGQDNSLSGVGADRADLVGDPSREARSDPNRDPVLEWFNTGAFAPNAIGTFGTSGRNILFGPGLANVDTSVAKYFSLTETWRLQFRSEFFNLFNRANFNQPSNTLTSGTYGRITSAGDPRILQFSLKLLF
ncbi:MAG: TonB-dependent receptor domain-containing protein, partial [Bryobacteraceae bacterium]